MIFRRARPEDAEPSPASSYRSLTRLPLTRTAPVQRSSSRRCPPRPRESYILSDRYDYLIAEVEDELAGFIAMQDKTHLFHLFVSPQYQRRGLARELWRRARDAAGPHDVAREFTVNSSLLAVPVYERFGFERVSAPVQRHGISFIRMRYAAPNA